MTLIEKLMKMTKVSYTEAEAHIERGAGCPGSLFDRAYDCWASNDDCIRCWQKAVIEEWKNRVPNKACKKVIDV